MGMKRALEGIKVLDLTAVLNGPFCTMILADYGADVLKVEPPEGESGRGMAPLLKETGESANHINWNRNKRSISLNLKEKKARDLFYGLVKEADVLVENFKPGVTSRLGIDYETIKKINPRIVYGSGSGFGQVGPLSQRPCYDGVAQAAGGIMSLTGYPDQPPVKVGSSIADHVTGIYLATGILIALFHRERTGEGQQVDVAMADSVFSILESAIVEYTFLGHTVQRNGNIDMTIAPFDTYESKNGYVMMGAGSDPLFKKMARALGRPDLLEDPRYRTNALRCQNYEPGLKELIQNWCREKTKKEIDEIMDQAGVPCSPVMNAKEVVESPQMRARNMVVDHFHPALGKVRIQGAVMKLSQTPADIRKSAPALGEDNAAVFGLTAEEVKQYKKEGIF